MPQLDQVTYFSQFFWLCFFFFGFYVCMVKYFLPALSRLMKVRQSQQSGTPEDALVSYVDFGADSLKTSRQSLVDLDTNLNQWIVQTQEKLNQESFLKMNQKFMASIRTQSFDTHQLFAQVNLVFPPAASPIQGAYQDFFTMKALQQFHGKSAKPAKGGSRKAKSTKKSA
uniref:H(+)-transporting two-sector ATPase n=1 Tax=Chloropicon maureeniae TaxID=1461542 RepID=A0A4D6C5Z6_9CHLO|nr:ATP synthase F0 subunit 8 [Chloropicon maureeniae]QBX98797.1 ATP synthase F0 subunit 8 [Chloropicon maureeniae]